METIPEFRHAQEAQVTTLMTNDKWPMTNENFDPRHWVCPSQISPA
jgi:hypothetical protein